MTSSHRNQLITLQSRPIDWFLYDGNISHFFRNCEYISAGGIYLNLTNPKRALWYDAIWLIEYRCLLDHLSAMNIKQHKLFIKLCTTMFDMSIYDNKKYNFSGPPAFKRQRVEYQSNQKLLHHYQHLNIQPNSYIHS